MATEILNSLIRQIIEIIRPHTILVVGKDTATLVEILRRHNFEVSASEAWVEDGDNYELILCLGMPLYLSAPQVERALEKLCQHTDTLLFAPGLLPDGDVPSPQPALEPWVEFLARFGFFHDLEADMSIPETWLACFRRDHLPPQRMMAAYERRLWQLVQEKEAYAAENVQLQRQLARKDEAVLAAETKLARFEGSLGWLLLQKMQSWRARLSPPGSLRDQALEEIFRASQTGDWRLALKGAGRLRQGFSQAAKQQLWQFWLQFFPPRQGRLIVVEALSPPPPVGVHNMPVDIVICVHNALSDVQNCLESIRQYTAPPYSLILVDDGSAAPARDYLANFFQSHSNVKLLRNELPLGYTKAANQGLRQASAEYILLLNSDTIVTPGWLDRLIACVTSNPRIGLAGPLSNAASWQSIPELMDAGDWATNLLPPGVSLEEMACLVARYSARLYPAIPFLNGFCLLLRRQALQEIGYFDEETFGAGYGEENDYVLRARQAGWQTALADDTYIYHAQSRSYSHDRRKTLSERASLLLAKKHGSSLISQGLAICRHDRVLEGIRARSRVMLDRQEWLNRGRREFNGRTLLFVLPILGPGGGANVVINEALVMQEMGVKVELFNLAVHQASFEQGYPHLALPVRYGTREDLAVLAGQYEAVVATANFAVEWLGPQSDSQPIRGYYVQDFEPYIYPPGSPEFRSALASYTLWPDLIRFTKTEWTRQEVKARTGAESKVIGVSLNIDLFRPRPRSRPAWPEGPLKVAAMVRLRPAYRNAKFTMEILRKLARHYGSKVEVMIFGVSLKDPGFAGLPHDFAWNLTGVLTQSQAAAFLNEADIFVDFSSHQAMGLTALEAMACGAAVMVPACGGAISFARKEENSLIVDTASPEACWQALQRLVEDHQLRAKLQQTALTDVCRFFPERAAFKILSTLFARTEASL